jgi:hypothetical protein
MSEEAGGKKDVSGTGSLTGSALEADDVLAGAEEWGLLWRRNWSCGHSQ